MSDGFGEGEAFIGFLPSPPPQQITIPNEVPSHGHDRNSNASSSHAGPSKSKQPPTGPKGKKRKLEDRQADYAGPMNLQQERAAAERNCPWATDVDWDGCEDAAEMEIDAYYRYMSPSPEEFEVRLLMIEAICRAIKREYPRAQIRPFGSWQTQLYLPQGDIDLVVTTDAFPQGSASIPKFLASMAQALRRANITDNVVIIAKAKVPIIKFVTIEGRIQVDISVNQTNGLSAGTIINSYLDSLPGARQLILVIKAFLSQRSLNEVFTGGLGSYSVICLVLSFLQIHPKMSRDHFNPEHNLGVLLMEFFELYGRNFHYDTDGISLLRGGSYYRKERKGFYQSARPFLLSIEDPQQPDNDISVGSYGIRSIRQAFSGAYEMLQVKLFERVEEITARRTGRSSARWEPADMTILGGIMGATKDMTRHRSRLREVYQSGRLRARLNIEPGADLSLSVSNYRKAHRIEAWTSARAWDRVRAAGPASEQDVGGGRPGQAPPLTVRGKANGQGQGGLGAVMMDDHDTWRLRGEFSSDEDDEEEAMNRSDHIPTSATSKSKRTQHSRTRRKNQYNDANDSGSDIQEVTSAEFESSQSQRSKNGSQKGRSARRNERYESVSHDSDDFSVRSAVVSRNDTTPSNGERKESETEDEDSRYAASKSNRAEKKRKLAAKGTDGGNGASASTSTGSTSESDSDIEIIERSTLPPKFGAAKPSAGLSIKGRADQSAVPGPNSSIVATQMPSNGESESSKAARQARKDFWASKGLKAGEGRGDDEVDEFGDGSDYVAL